MKPGMPRVVWVLAVVAAIFAAGAVFAAFKRARRVDLPVLAEVPPFAMKDQLGRPVTTADLRGTPWIAVPARLL